MTAPEAPSSARRKDRLINTNLAGKYKILKKIGEGGMGSVYIANQEPIDRKVAVKVLLGKLAEDEIAVKRFEQEARAISKMQHPNTVTIYDFGRTEDDQGDERLYLVMEYLKGQTLTQVLRNDQQVVGVRASRIIRQVCASLADAHAAGIIHRDLKPDNIFLTEVGGDRDWVKVLDFGVAKLADSEMAGTLTQTGMIFGTPKYMSPEQAEGRPIDYRADIYALGIIMFELVSGRPPFLADTPVALLLKHIQEDPPTFESLRPDLNIEPQLEAIVRKAMAKDPAHRFQQVSELAAELENYERTVSGGYVLPTGTVPTPMSSGLPTEVIPGAAPSDSGLTPSGLPSPHQVPDGLSAGVVAPPARTEPGSAPDLLQTEAGRVVGSGTDAHSGVTPAAQPSRGTAWWMPVGITASVAAAAVVAVWLTNRSSQAPSVNAVRQLVEIQPGPGPATPSTPTAGAAEKDPGSDPPVPEDPLAGAAAPSTPAEDRKTELQRARPSLGPPRQPLRVESDPPRARVYLDGEQVGVTPVELPPMEVGRTVRLTFRRRGFDPVTKEFTIGQDQSAQAELPRRAAAPLREPPPGDQELLNGAMKLKKQKDAEKRPKKVSDLK